MKGKKMLSCMICLITAMLVILAGCAPDPIPVTEVKLSAETLELKTEETAVLKASLVPDDADTGTAITWSSSDEKVATVKDGTVTALKPGETVIKAESGNGKSASCKVTVMDPYAPPEVQFRKVFTDDEYNNAQPLTDYAEFLVCLKDYEAYLAQMDIESDKPDSTIGGDILITEYTSADYGSVLFRFDLMGSEYMIETDTAWITFDGADYMIDMRTSLKEPPSFSLTVNGRELLKDRAVGPLYFVPEENEDEKIIELMKDPIMKPVRRAWQLSWMEPDAKTVGRSEFDITVNEKIWTVSNGLFASESGKESVAQIRQKLECGDKSYELLYLASSPDSLVFNGKLIDAADFRKKYEADVSVLTAFNTLMTKLDDNTSPKVEDTFTMIFTDSTWGE